jgi:hypothetical protein
MSHSPQNPPSPTHRTDATIMTIPAFLQLLSHSLSFHIPFYSQTIFEPLVESPILIHVNSNCVLWSTDLCVRKTLTPKGTFLYAIYLVITHCIWLSSLRFLPQLIRCIPSTASSPTRSQIKSWSIVFCFEDPTSITNTKMMSPPQFIEASMNSVSRSIAGKPTDYNVGQKFMDSLKNSYKKAYRLSIYHRTFTWQTLRKSAYHKLLQRRRQSRKWFKSSDLESTCTKPWLTYFI